MWDERSTQHCAVQGFEGLEERMMHRVCVEGDAPFGPATMQRERQAEMA